MKPKDDDSKKQPADPLDVMNLPLYDLYEKVKRLDEGTDHATVDTQSYLVLLETLQRGYMLMDKQELLLLCEKLWLKPYHRNSNILNKSVLEQLLDQALENIAQAQEAATKPAAQQPNMRTPKTKRKQDPDKTLPPVVKPPAPSAMDKQLSRQQGSLSIYIDTIDTEPETSFASGNDADAQFINKSFLVKGAYLPVNPRRIEQAIRSYRHRLSSLYEKEIDWQQTTIEIGRKGHFEEFMFKSKDVFTSSFTVLIDSSPSMAAFGAYTQEIATAVSRRSRGGLDEVFYFKNYPTTHIYSDKLQFEAVTLDQFEISGRKSILIISDAGAARGMYNPERVQQTRRFLKRLQKHKVAWLNPIPRNRWRNSSAEIIASYTDMFDIGEGSMELGNIVRLFKLKIMNNKK
jgi:uncharacterized protein